MELTEKEFYDIVGKKIKALRERAGHKQEDFAQLLDLSRASIVNIEKGRQTPSFYLVWKLSKIFDTKLEYFFDLNDAQAYQGTTTLSESHEKEFSELAKEEFKESPETLNRLRNFVIESLSST